MRERKTASVTIQKAEAEEIALELIDRNAWFECMPLPDGMVAIKTKDEGHLENYYRNSACMGSGMITKGTDCTR